ncbi:MAG: hypothetical protein Q9197_004561 [Variospora fuerteventurae]
MTKEWRVKPWRCCGGTIVSTFSKSENELLKNSNFSLLIRGPDKARVFNDKGFQTVLFDSLEDTETVENTASKYDNTTPDLYSYLQQRNALTPYAQRTADIAVISTGLALNVKTYIMPPTIYVTGIGDFIRITIQAPAIVQSALRTGQIVQLGDNNAVAEHVHVEDLAELYIAVANKVIKDGMQGFPSGERGTGNILCWNGETYVGRIYTRHCSVRELNAIKTDEIKKVGLTEAAEMWTDGNELYCELNFGASWRTQADASRKLGWQPQKTEEDFESMSLILRGLLWRAKSSMLNQAEWKLFAQYLSKSHQNTTHPKMLFRRTAITLSRRAAFTPIPRRAFTTSLIRRDDGAADAKRDIKTDPEKKHHRLDPIPGQTEDMIPFEDIKSENDLRPPGAAPGTIPTDLEQATGLERFEILGKMQGIDVFDMKPLDASRLGNDYPTFFPQYNLFTTLRATHTCVCESNDEPKR